MSFDVYLGEVLGVVGELGCGKLMLGKVIVCLYEVILGVINFDGYLIYEFGLSKFCLI